MKTFHDILTERGLTPTTASRACGMPLVTVATHFYGSRRISPESAIIYEQKLGIPRWETRPDLWGNDDDDDERKSN